MTIKRGIIKKFSTRAPETVGTALCFDVSCRVRFGTPVCASHDIHENSNESYRKWDELFLCCCCMLARE